MIPETLNKDIAEIKDALQALCHRTITEPGFEERRKLSHMVTFKRICIRDFSIADKAGNIFSIERGKEYITSAVDPESAHVIVFSNFWVPVPVEYFAGEIQYTG